jgi:hypothetical protein
MGLFLDRGDGKGEKTFENEIFVAQPISQSAS